jgi:hypothetical protein
VIRSHVSDPGHEEATLDPLTIAALSSSTVKILQQAMKEWLSQRGNDRVHTKSTGGSYDIDLNQVSPALLDRVQQLLSTQSQATPNILELSRQASLAEQGSRATGTRLTHDSEVVGLALALDPDSVFRDARRRTGLVFQLNLGFAIILGIIMLAGIAGAFYSALVLGKPSWATAFGGISAADVLGLYAFKPLAAINSALVSATRLDNMQLRLKMQLEQCSKYSNIDDRLRCQTAVWEAIQKELASLQ